jgi:hypothetical protein
MAARLIHKYFVDAYVYAIVVDGVVRYVGKGRRYRAVEHLRIANDLNARRANGEKIKARHFYNKLAKAIRSDSVVEVRVILSGLSDDDAYDREITEIASYPAGQLWNKQAGGSGGDPEFLRQVWRMPGVREKIIRTRLITHRTEEFREQQRRDAKEYWDDPEFHAKQVAREKAMWADPVKRAERIAILKRVWADPEKSARKSVLVKSQWTPERRAAMAENRRKAWADPEFKKRAGESIRKSRTPDVRKILRQKATMRWANPEFRARVMSAMRKSPSKNDASQGCLFLDST